jgi:predicted transglutaminase-like cysteine proteinase
MTPTVARRTHTVQQHLARLLLTALLVAGIHGPGRAAEPGKQVPVRLFGTIEFQSSLKSLPQWLRVLCVVERQMEAYNGCRQGACTAAAKSWRQVIRLSNEKPPMDRLKTVNAFFNQWPYRLDIEVYGKSDHWASPNEFLKLSGDCEDYSIIKYFALRQLGFEMKNLRIVVVKDRIRNIGHAVLAVYLDGSAYILDNLSNMVLPHSRYQHYIPQYSVNEANRWAHIRPIGKQGF